MRRLPLWPPASLCSLLSVGDNLKRPRFPVWLVCSESHFSTLFVMPSEATTQSVGAADAAAHAWASGGTGIATLQPPVVLDYYDPIAAQEGRIQLRVGIPRSGGGWASRLRGVHQERGTWQGNIIPPLECVIETLWPDVEITWHGSEPLL